MKRLSVIFASLVFATSLEAQTPPDLVARIHFLGGDKISTDTNSAVFANEFTSPEARALESQTFDKLSKFFSATFKSKTSVAADDGSAQLRPLLDDLLKSEWILEMRDAPGSSEYALAIRLSPERAQFWSKNLQMVLQSWTGVGASADKSGNWELKKNSAPNLTRFVRAQGWIVIGVGENELPLMERITQSFSHAGTLFKDEGWFSADLNWPRLAQLFPALREFDFPKIQMQVVGRDGNFHFTGKLNLSQPLPPLEKWRVPTNAIHQPFASFTAARGVASWLQKQSWFQPYVLQPQPDQVFVWALPQVPFQTFAAEPMANANASLAQLHNNLSANANWQNQFMMPIRMTLTNSIVLTVANDPVTHSNKIKPVIEKDGLLSFTGIPFIAPYIRADHEADGDFLFGGFFPNTPRSKPLPSELFEQLSMPNLVYYHWEITAERLKELPELSQLLLMATRHRQLGGKSVASQWLNRFGPAFGNSSSITIITETSPTELSFTRKAPGGLTAVELLALANWLESPNFPALDLRLPPRPRLQPGAHPKILSAPPSMSMPLPSKK